MGTSWLRSEESAFLSCVVFCILDGLETGRGSGTILAIMNRPSIGARYAAKWLSCRADPTEEHGSTMSSTLIETMDSPGICIPLPLLWVVPMPCSVLSTDLLIPTPDSSGIARGKADTLPVRSILRNAASAMLISCEWHRHLGPEEEWHLRVVGQSMCRASCLCLSVFD
jgi:hypothetical protein